ncbi:elongation factor P [Candidatus Nomurabacteria bacterium]|nr:elongation factor P [Candidatus Nomurabacteria bacterium]USN94586.1 MAG: elongation factor P [Candidatus Nomurabacteria bacterium]
MAKLAYNEIKERKIILWNGEPFLVLESHVARTQQRKPQNQVKMRSLVNGRAVNETFRSSDVVDEADIEKKETKFIYENRGEYWFCDPDDPKNRFQISKDVIGDQNAKFLKENETVKSMIFRDGDNEQIIGVDLPIKMTFVVKDAPPNIKGDTATGGNKQVTLENGTTILVPLFIEAGEKVVVNTQTGEYVEREK